MRTRRLVFRPSVVPLSATGLNSPNPMISRRFGSIPALVKRCTTLAARAADSYQFEGNAELWIGRSSV